MKKSLSSFLQKLGDNNASGANKGFRVLKNVRGGKLRPGENPNCHNDRCTGGINTGICTNRDCTEDVTNQQCTNSGCFA